MALPDLPPNFAASAPFGAWWGYQYPGRAANACATSGASLVRAVRAALALPAAPNAWDDALLVALAAHARRAGHGAHADAITAALAQPSIPEAAVHHGVWAAYYAPHGLPADGLTIPQPATFPARGAVLTEDAPSPIACWAFATQPEPAALNARDLASARALSTAGLRLAPGEPVPRPASPTPRPAAGSGASALALVAIGVGFVALAYWGDKWLSARKPAGRRPARARPMHRRLAYSRARAR